MKKIITLLLAVILCFSCLGLVGCQKTSRNTVIAKVGDEQLTLGEVTDLFWNYGYQFVYYYGYEVEDVVEAHIQELTTEKAYVVLAKENLEKVSPNEKGNLQFLTEKEIKELQYRVEVAVYNNIVSYAQDLAKEDEVEVKTSSSRADAPEDSTWWNSDVIPTLNAEQGPISGDEYLAPYWKDAVKELKNVLKKTNRTISSWKNDILSSFVNSKIIEKYQDEVYDNEIKSQYTEDYVKEALAEQVKSEKESFLTKDAYFKQLGSIDDCDMIVYNPFEGYGFVRQILIPFSEVQAEDLKAQKEALSETDYIEYRENLAKQLVAKEQRTPLNFTKAFDAKDNVNVFEDGSFYNGFYKVLTNAMGSFDEENKTFNGLSDGQEQIFEEFLWAYNTDSGALSNLRGYAINPDGDSSFVAEFIALGRDLLKKGVGAIDYCITDYGIHYLMTTELISKYDEKTDCIKWEERDVEGSFTFRFIETLRESQGDYALQNNLSKKVVELDEQGKISRAKDGKENCVTAIYGSAQ